MIDIKQIRDTPRWLDKGLHRRNLPPQSAEILAIDEERRKVQTQLQELQEKRNSTSEKIGTMKKKGQDVGPLMTEIAGLKAEIAKLEETDREVFVRLINILNLIPNVPDEEVPLGKDESDNQQIRAHGQPKPVGKNLEHFDIGFKLGLMDFETASKMSGARFVMLKGALAQMERALANFMLDIHTSEFGYTEISPPLMVRDEIMYGTAQLPKFMDDQFQLKNNDMWLIPTAEVPLTNIVYDSIVDESQLPIRVTAKTPCFRAEAGAAGKDTRGMLRQHQFYKVELVSITTPEQSKDEHERMTDCAETILKRLEIPYRTMLLCSGDMGFASKKTYDIEVWLPGQNTYREISSCSNCGDFQAKRMRARLRRKDRSIDYVHTLNGSGIAVGRALIAVLENYQREDGSVYVPKVLRPYMGGLEKILIPGTQF